MPKERRACCEWCGEDIGLYDPAYPGPDSCGEVKCNREVNYMIAESDARARDEAEEDGFGRYGGSGGW